MDEKIVRFSWPHENDLVFRRDAIEAIIRETNQDGAYGYGDTKSLVNVLDALPSAQPDLTHIVFETLAECGIYGEEATVKFIGTLKRLGRSDLLPPCAR